MTPEQLAKQAAKIEKQLASLQKKREEVGQKRPPVHLKELCPDRCNFKDRAFESAVQEFMQKYMNGFDVTDLADEEGNHDIEAWEFTLPGRYKVREGEGDLFVGDENRILADGEEKPADSEGSVIIEWYWIEDTEYGKPVSPSDARGEDAEVSIKGEEAAVWYEEDEAARFAEEQDREHMEEGRYGFPWAHNWSYRPEGFIKDYELTESGFVVAEFRGDRVCSIDGGGYSFAGAHYAPLFAKVAERCGWLVETDGGPRLITTEKQEE